MKLFVLPLALALLVACDEQSRAPAPLAPALATAALEDSARTIAYSGYVDFDGTPVNAGAVDFNFVIFPCATPGTGANQCAPLWVAKGTWTASADWTQGWPSTSLTLPVFAGRFAVELGATTQNPLPTIIFDEASADLWLGVRIAGKSLGTLQKLAPAPRTAVAQLAHHAEVADLVGDLSPDELLERGTWTATGNVPAGQSLTVETYGDASQAQVLVFEKRGGTWQSIAPESGFLDDPALAAYYPLEDNTGTTVVDASGHGRNLTLTRGVTLEQPGVFGRSAKFGGSGPTDGGDLTNANMALALGSELTIAYWLKPTAFPAYPSDVHVMTLDPTGNGHLVLHSWYAVNCSLPRYLIRGPDSGGGCSLSGAELNTWTHIAVTLDTRRKVGRMYVNGVLDASWPEERVPDNTTLGYLRFGARFTGAGYDYSGWLDDFVIFTRTLRQSEIEDLVKNGVAHADVHVDRGADGVVKVANRSGVAKTLRAVVVK